MKAFQFETVAAGLELRDVPVPEPGYEQVLIAVKAAGLCHSDIHVLNGGGEAWMRAQSLTLGHEVAGTVVKLGPGASEFPFKTGDRVTVALLGQPVIDRDFQEAIGVGYDGGYAEFAVAYCKQLVKIPAGVSFAQAAVATDSVATAYHAIMCEARVAKSTRVAVIGLGGLGLNGVAIAAIQGAEVYGVDINTTKFDQALKAGAIKCASSLDQFSNIVFDVIFDFAGMQSTIAAAVSTVKLGGCVVLVGLGSPTIQLETTSIVTRNIQLRGSVSASIDDLHKVLALIAAGSLSPTVQEIPFLDVPKGLEMLHKKDVNGRLFTIPIR
ncbi:chaperonin 10-like protein [Ilyonectria robusta]|uniref:chaperonin 10-like protein n=1 Tax=Ilyonectria robusta TaxID=1079257 RepID=UPI001E8E1F56|nr:chaperonin 10-like protein [Ilyonectria robusta]KAH8665462.1 chaperonin 10-like protein [Ilyonectria robusta]